MDRCDTLYMAEMFRLFLIAGLFIFSCAVAWLFGSWLGSHTGNWGIVGGAIVLCFEMAGLVLLWRKWEW
jgi:uncharacterized membrane protein YdjX (TVP38/TMEM64 family)